MTPPIEESLHELSGSYAVHALTGTELSEFEAHLHDCAQCREEVRSFREALTELDGVIEVAPPPAVRSNVLAAIAGTAQLPPIEAADGPRHAAQLDGQPDSQPDSQQSGEPDSRAGSASEDGVRGTVAERSGGTVADLGAARERRERRTGRGRAWIAVAAAAAVIAVGAGGWAVNLNRQLEQQQQAQVAGQQLNQRESALLNAPDAKVYATTLNDGTPVSYVVSKRLNQAMLVAADVRSPGADRVWQLWTVPGSGQPVRDTTFAAGTNQRVFMTGDIDRAGALAITVERAGSTPTAPTMTPFAVVKL